MQKAIANQFGSAIYDALIPKNLEGKHLDQKKMLSNSKSVKTVSNSRSIGNAFEKKDRKAKVQVESKYKKQKFTGSK